MLFNKNGIKVFTEYDLGSALNNQLERIKDVIKTRNLHEQSKPQVVESLMNEYKVQPLAFHVEDIAVSVDEVDIPSEYFPNSGFIVRPGEAYPKNIYTFHLPFDGDESFLRCAPSTRILWTEEMAVENHKVVFQIIDFYNSTEKVKSERDRISKFLSDQSAHVNRDIDQHNQQLESFISQQIGVHEDKENHRKNTLAELGKPINSISSRPVNNVKAISQPTQKEEKKYDVFISHASEDKDYVDKLAKKLKKDGLEVWYDTFEVNWGDDLRTTIDNGLKNSKFGIVIFSDAFLKKKKWTEYELNGLFARERDGMQVVLPLWHKVTRIDIEKYSPAFADRVAMLSDDLNEICKELRKKLASHSR